MFLVKSRRKYQSAMIQKTITVLLLAIAPIFLYAQEAKETQQPTYLFQKNGETRISGFGAPIFEFSSFQGEFAFSTGGGGAVLINNQFFIGGYGLGMVSMNELNYSVYSMSSRISYPHTVFGHGGLWMGYILQPNKVIHLALSTKIGFGGITYSNNTFGNWWDENEWAVDGVFVFTPQAEVELNLLKWFKFNAGIGYRLVSGAGSIYYDIDGNPTFNNKDLSGLTGSITLMFGWF